MRLAAALLVVVALADPRPAAADDNDLVLSRLGRLVRDQDGQPLDAVGDNQAFRSLASELGVVLAPRFSDGADTLGWNGFAVTADLAFTNISADRGFWRALESSPAPNEPNVEHGSSVMTTVGVFAKKGLWLPIPSFEFGVGAVHLLRSRIWSAQAFAKVALHEGFHDLPLPSFALRGGVSRMTGSSDLNLTSIALDAIASKDFGVGGTFRITPYAGAELLLVVARSEVIDATPDIDPLMEPVDRNADFAFVDQDTIIRTRFVAGGTLTYSVLRVGLEAAIARAGRSTDDRAGTSLPCDDATSPTSACDARDGAGRQTTFTVTVGADF
jgi:hypothetical protein